MPISKYYKGHGEEVMASMNKTYKDPEKAKSVFYALANKKPGFKPPQDRSKAILSRRNK